MVTPTRDECRRYFADCGLSYDVLDRDDIEDLQLMLGDKMLRCRKNPTGSYHKTWKISKHLEVKTDKGGHIKEAYIKCFVGPGQKRECVSFNKDGFIGFCGEFDDNNARPILMTFIKWCRLMGGADDARRGIQDSM